MATRKSAPALSVMNSIKVSAENEGPSGTLCFSDREQTQIAHLLNLNWRSRKATGAIDLVCGILSCLTEARNRVVNEWRRSQLEKRKALTLAGRLVRSLGRAGSSADAMKIEAEKLEAKIRLAVHVPRKGRPAIKIPRYPAGVAALAFVYRIYTRRTIKLSKRDPFYRLVSTCLRYSDPWQLIKEFLTEEKKPKK